jgi:hypothetical protein
MAVAKSVDTSERNLVRVKRQKQDQGAVGEDIDNTCVVFVREIGSGWLRWRVIYIRAPRQLGKLSYFWRVIGA